MDSVRTAAAAGTQELHRMPCPTVGRPCSCSTADALRTEPAGVPVLDVIHVLATIALFALVGLVAKGVEKL